MTNRIRWFVAGCVATALLIGVLALGVSLLSHPADAQGTWQVKTFSAFPLRSPDELKTPLARPDPEHFVEDWAATLPDSCDIVPTQDERLFLFRCP